MNYRLSKSRKKRPVPEGWAGTEDVSSGQQLQSLDSSAPDSSSLAVGPGLTAVSGKGGDVAVYSHDGDKIQLVHSFNIGSPIMETVYAEPNLVFGTSKGEVKIYTTAGVQLASFSEHAGAVTGLALHPGGVILVSVGLDKSFAYYDVTAFRTVLRRYTDSCKLTSSFFFMCPATRCSNSR